jgi:hypothetical protein
MVIENCSSGIEYVNINWGSSEAIPGSGGGCITRATGGANTGGPCGVGTFTSTVDLALWVDLLGSCDFPAGDIPGIDLDGRVYDASAAAPAGVCGYSAAQVDGLITLAGGSGYLLIACDSQTLPDGLAAACISGSDFDSVIVAKTGANASDCPDCSGGCVAATADGVE